jgi:hypothetical protein
MIILYYNHSMILQTSEKIFLDHKILEKLLSLMFLCNFFFCTYFVFVIKHIFVLEFQAMTRGEDAMTLFFVCGNPNCGYRWRD